jgi:adenylate cyclase
MFSDIAGYTALMGRDERQAIRALAEHRELVRSLVARFNGRMIGDIGDGTLASFHSALEAVSCAREIQASIQGGDELRVRIGIHVGDILFSNAGVIGDGVNVASRIHALAPPGGVCVSERVYDDLRNKPEFKVRDLGRQTLKNVSRPIRVYQIVVTDLVAQPAEPSGLRRRTALIAGVGALVLAGLILVLVRLRSPTPSRQQALSGVKRKISSIAVLPLDNFSGDPKQEYFSDGLTDELTTDLATISALRVISRGSVMQYKGAHRPPTPEIAKALNVDAVVEGSVMRVGDKVRITAQLIDAQADRHLWAKSYERDSRDVLALQDEVALAIARQINVELTPDEQARFASSRVVNPEAHEAYLKGRYFMSSYSEKGLKKAIGQFEQAIKADPNFAPAYTGLADAYGYGFDSYFPATEVGPKARAAAEKALQLDNTLAEAHASLSFVQIWYDFDLAGGESTLRRAIALNPNYAEAHHLYGYLLAEQGRFDESLAESKRAAELDPLSAGIASDVSLPLMFQGKYEAAKKHSRKAMELDPGFYLGQEYLGWIDLQAGKFNEAIPELEKARAMDSAPLLAGYLGYAYAAAGERAKAEATIAELSQMSSRRFVSPFCTAIIYIGLGDKQRALEGLEKAYEVRSQWLLFLKVDRIFNPLRSDPRFIELLKKVGLNN